VPVCPQDRLCEGGCTLNDARQRWTIGLVEEILLPIRLCMGWLRILLHVSKTGKKSIHCVRARPVFGWLIVLARAGVKPGVFDRYRKSAVCLNLGIPEFKLEKLVMSRRREILKVWHSSFA